MFEADLWNADSLSSANFSVNIGVQRDSFPAPCRQERPSLRFKRTAKFFLQAPGTVYICNGRRRKVDRKALLLEGFLRKLGSCNLQTQAVRLGEKLDLQSPNFMVSCKRHN